MSFSIHLLAERKDVATTSIADNYDLLEKDMLDEFFHYIDRNRDRLWLHWNMRDSNYGFPALIHRHKVLGGIAPFEIPEGNMMDLARVLIALYGVQYIQHPRLTTIVSKNDISSRDFLSGQLEAAAFEAGEFVKLHQSTLRKVDIIANLAERANTGSLKTNAKWKHTYLAEFAFVIQQIKNHWFLSTVAVFLAIAGVIKTIYEIFFSEG